MSQVAHAERAHALLSASGADRWINCPPSARLTDGMDESRSEYADEGTAAHELSEIVLRRTVYPCDSKQRKSLDKQLTDFKANNQYYCPEMQNAVESYVEIVYERFMEARARSSDAVILLEDRLDYSDWVEDGTGTGDVVIIADGILEIIDLKYGKGIAVYASGNPQLRLYGLGAWSAYNFLYDIRQIRMTIIQPRLDSISSDTMDVDDILEWAENVVKPAAVMAFAGEGDFKAGSHCKWCKVKGNCKARADANMTALQYEFKDPALLTLEEVGSIMYVAQQLKAWAKDVEDYAFDQALKGNNIPLWKIVEGRSNRAITDKEAVRAVFEEAAIKPDTYLKPQEMMGIGDLEKRIGKKELNALIGDLIIKPQGKPVLVPETDPRSEMNSIDGDFAGEEFSDG